MDERRERVKNETKNSFMKYFAYGSNMNPERMEKRVLNFTKGSSAKLKGYRLKFNKRADRNPLEGYANIVTSVGSIVEGILYEISKDDFCKIDKNEGVPIHYERKKITVQVINNKEIEAETYIANPSKIKDSLKPTKEYLEHLLKAKDMLSNEYYNWLKSTETLDQLIKNHTNYI